MSERPPTADDAFRIDAQLTAIADALGHRHSAGPSYLDRLDERRLQRQEQELRELGDGTPPVRPHVDHLEVLRKAAIAFNAALLDASRAGFHVECGYASTELIFGEVTMIDTVRLVERRSTAPGLAAESLARHQHAHR